VVAKSSTSCARTPKKDPSKYDADDVAHMRRVAAYCKRHLVQEEKAKQDTSSKEPQVAQELGRTKKDESGLVGGNVLLEIRKLESE
jgi:hypothetical protein